jgi:hypothetical protein
MSTPVQTGGPVVGGEGGGAQRAVGRRTIWDHTYRELVLPAVTAAALIGLLMKDYTPEKLSWWGALFFVLYYAAQHTRVMESDRYNALSLLCDSVGIAVFFWISRQINLFESGSLVEWPRGMFIAMTAVPATSILSRLAMDLKPRWVLVAVGLLCSAVGLIDSWTVPGKISWWAMRLLLADLGCYLIINFLEDGDPSADWRKKLKDLWDRCRAWITAPRESA